MFFFLFFYFFLFFFLKGEDIVKPSDTLKFQAISRHFKLQAGARGPLRPLSGARAALWSGSELLTYHAPRLRGGRVMCVLGTPGGEPR